MPLESATRISQLVATNPTSTDLKSEGDDHLRLIKAAVQGSFPNIGATAVTATAEELNFVDGVTSNVQTQLDAKAPLASPALTGTPTATTATPLTNSTRIATTAYADAAVAAEAALRVAGDAMKANIASPTFTGTVTVPTPVNTTDAATKGYADGLSVAAGNVPVGGSTAQVLRKNSATNYDMSWATLAVATATTSGLVPTPPNNTTTFLRGDATFATVTPPGLTLLSSYNMTSASSVDVETTFDSTYDEYVIYVTGAISADNVAILARQKIGGTYQTSGAYVTSDTDLSTGTYSGAVSSTATSIPVGPAGHANGRGVDSVITLSQPTASKRQTMGITTTTETSSAAVHQSRKTGMWGTAGVLSGVRLFPSTGIFSAGTVRLYGIRK